MIKKILKVIGILLVLLLAAIFILPIVFKDDIIAKVKEEINNNVNAQVDFGDFDLSLISSFPDFTFSIESIRVVGVDEFEGVKLADIGAINLVVDLMSVINGESIQIKVVEIVSPEMNVIVTKEGKANYDIAKASETEVEEVLEEEEEESTGEETSFRMELEKLEITSANITYDDREGNMYAGIENFNFLLSGDFTADVSDIFSDMSISAITYKMDGVPYLNKAEIEVHAELEADVANSKYTFTENSFRINQLVLGLDGWVQTLENDEMDMDLTFNAKQTSFKSILSLVPAVYARDFASVQTNGQLALSGFAKGKMAGENYPSFGVDMSIKDANFKYPDLPKSVDNIQVAVNVNSPGGDLNNMIIQVSTFHIELAGNPFDMNLLLKTPMTDPFIKAGLKGDLALGSIKDVVPMEEGEEMDGLISMNISLEGNQSTIDEERYEEFDAKGNLVISAMTYKSPDLPYAVSIDVIDVDLAPKYVTLNKMKMMVGRSDFSANGQVEKFIPYVFDEEAVLIARLNLNSNLIDATEFMEEEAEESTTGEATEGGAAEGEEEAPMEVVEIPGNIDFELNSSIGKIHMADYDIDNFKGAVTMRDRKMSLENTSMDMLGGKIITTGSYETSDPKRPTFDFNLDVIKFDVKTTVTTFNTVEKLVPLLKKSEGGFSTKFDIQGVFDDKMEVIGESLYGKGVLKTHELGLKDFAPLELAADKLKREDLRNPRMDNMNITFTITGGKMFMDPFDVKAGNVVTTLSGWTAFDETIEYKMNMAIPSEDFGGAANQAAATVLSMLQEKTGQNVNVELPKIVNIKGLITGTVDDPKIALDLPSLGGGSAKKDAKKMLEEELAKKKKELEEKAKAEAERLKKEAEAKARAEAERLKKEGEAKAKAEAERLKKKAEEDAKRKIEEEKKKQQEAAKKKAEEEAKKKLKGLIK